MLTPEEYLEIERRAERKSEYFQGRMFPMAGASLQIPFLDITPAQSAGVSPFFGGLQMYWTAEAQTRTVRVSLTVTVPAPRWKWIVAVAR